jgi:hypothetical protein
MAEIVDIYQRVMSREQDKFRPLSTKVSNALSVNFQNSEADNLCWRIYFPIPNSEEKREEARHRWLADILVARRAWDSEQSLTDFEQRLLISHEPHTVRSKQARTQYAKFIAQLTLDQIPGFLAMIEKQSPEEIRQAIYGYEL